jgi:hypothetical protein
VVTIIRMDRRRYVNAAEMSYPEVTCLFLTWGINFEVLFVLD